MALALVVICSAVTPLLMLPSRFVFLLVSDRRTLLSQYAVLLLTLFLHVCE